MVNEISALIMQNPHPEELIQLLIEAIHRGIGVDRTLLFLRDPARDSITGRLGLGYDVPPFLNEISLPTRSDGPLGKAIQDKEAFNSADGESHLESGHPRLEIPAFAEIQAFALVPFLAGKEVIGLVVVDNTFTHQPITDHEVGLIGTFLNLAGTYLARYAKKTI